MLAEGRSAGLDAVFAWQYTAQIRDEVIRSGVRSLLQSISIFRMREMEDARSPAGLAMEVYSDRISVDHDEQERLRFSPDDVVKLPIHRAINLWVADGTRAGFLAHTLDGTARRRRARRRTSSPSATAAATTPSSFPIRSATGVDARSGAADAAPEQPAQADRAHCGNRARADHVLRPRLMLPASYTDLIRYDGAAVQRDRRDQTVPCAIQPRDVEILADIWRYKFLTATQLLRAALARLRAARRPQTPHQALPRRPRRALPTRHPHRGSFPGPTTSATTATACSAGPALSTATHGSNCARSTTTATSFTRSTSTPGSSPGGDCSGRRYSPGAVRPNSNPPLRPAADRCVSTTTARSGACDGHTASRTTRRHLGNRAPRRWQPRLPDRVRPHQANRQELRQVPALRHLPVLVVAPHPSSRTATTPFVLFVCQDDQQRAAFLTPPTGN